MLFVLIKLHGGKTFFTYPLYNKHTTSLRRTPCPNLPKPAHSCPSLPPRSPHA
jgi:hypothetical protein